MQYFPLVKLQYFPRIDGLNASVASIYQVFEIIIVGFVSGLRFGTNTNITLLN